MLRIAVLATMLCGACTDAATLPSVRPAPVGAPVEDKYIIPDTADGPAPGGGGEAAYIISAASGIFWPTMYPGNAQLGATTAYFGMRAETSGYFSARTYGTWLDVRRSPQYVKPDNRTFYARWDVVVAAGCGETYRTRIDYKAVTVGTLTVGVSDQRREEREYVMPDCTAGSGAPSGTQPVGGSATFQRCYYLTEDHWEYDPVTGESTYLYTTETLLYCQMMG